MFRSSQAWLLFTVTLWIHLFKKRIYCTCIQAFQHWVHLYIFFKKENLQWPHRLDGHEFEQALGAGDGQGSLVCCSPWGCKESDITEQLNWTELTELSWMECYFFVSCLFSLLAHWCNNWHTSSHLVNYYGSHMPGMTEQKDRYPIFPIFLFMKTVYHILLSVFLHVQLFIL